MAENFYSLQWDETKSKVFLFRWQNFASKAKTYTSQHQCFVKRSLFLSANTLLGKSSNMCVKDTPKKSRAFFWIIGTGALEPDN